MTPFDICLTADFILGGGLAVTAYGWTHTARKRRTAQAENGQLRDQLAAAGRATTTLKSELVQLRDRLTEAARVNRGLEGEAGHLRERVSEADRTARAMDEEIAHLAARRLPALIEEARGFTDMPVPGLTHPELAGTPIESHLEQVLAVVREALETTRTEIARSARSTVRDLLEEPQTFFKRAHNGVWEAMEKHADAPEVVSSLMVLEHMIRKAMRSVQRLRILGGSWPGLQHGRAPIADIISSAIGRIDPYKRVEHHHDARTGNVWVHGRYVEPLAVALAELLDNATAFSHAPVYVSVHEVQAGYLIFVDDSGPGLNEYQRHESVQAIKSGAVLDVTSLTDSLALGWYVVGRLCTEYDFQANVSASSPYGGARAVLTIPTALVATAATPEEEAAARRPSSTVPGAYFREDQPTARPTAPAPQPMPTTTPNGLPQRRRREPLPAETSEQRPRYQAENADADTFAASMARIADAFTTDTTDTDAEGQPR